jgi:hypothetical protein
MLTIQNFQRLKGKVIGSTGYYVHDIKPVLATDVQPPYESKDLYWIEITNRKQVMVLHLDRIGFATGRRIRLYELKLGQNFINLNKFELRNMDVVLDKINKLVLEQYVP